MPGRSQIKNLSDGVSKPWIPPGLFDVAAIMRVADPNVQLKIMDELAGDIVTEQTLPEADLYGIGGLSTSRLRAFELVEMIHRTRKGKVIVGGMDVTASYRVGDAARFQRRFDAIVTGLFPVDTCRELFSDLEVGRLKDVYLSDPARVDEWVVPAYDLIDPNKYVAPYAPQLSRGCVFNCPFCTVDVMCDHVVNKPPSKVTEEFQSMPWSPIMVVKDDSFGTDWDLTVNHILPLIKQRGSVMMAELPAKWLLGDEERKPLLEPMATSGCGIFYIGVENLKPISGKSIPPDGYEEVVTRAHKLGSLVVGSFTIGSRSDDTVKSFLATVDWSKRVGFDAQQHSNIAALPGSKLRELALRKGEIVDYNPEHYDGAWPTIVHAMTAKERIEVLAEANARAYSTLEIAKKVSRLPGLIRRRPELLGLRSLIVDAFTQIRKSTKLWSEQTGYEYWLRTRWETDRP